MASNSQKNIDLQRNAVKILTLDLNQRSDLPYVYTYIKSKGKSKSEHLTLFPMLLDSGSEVNLIGIKMLEKLGLNVNQIIGTQQYNIKSSTEIKKNCILGKIDLNLNLLIKSDDESTSGFGKCKESFLVAGHDVILNKVILGTPFLGKHSIRMFFNPNSCRVVGNFLTETGFNKISLMTKYKEKTFLQSVNSTEIIQGMNNTTFKTNRFILEKQYTSLVNDKSKVLRMPRQVELKPTGKICYKSNGWMLLKHDKFFQIPIDSATNFEVNKIQIRLNYTQKRTENDILEVQKCKVQKSVKTDYKQMKEDGLWEEDRLMVGEKAYVTNII